MALSFRRDNGVIQPPSDVCVSAEYLAALRQIREWSEQKVLLSTEIQDRIHHDPHLREAFEDCVNAYTVSLQEQCAYHLSRRR